ncbi:M43 family zinc metalloprotease [Nocardiopsis mangrovi]|uniref:M43 family zinc metalloprotease n=1 Tax=Nocardiopsis mangrovi TaxID=1179818 RepID=A0ABV9E6T7_9ACTN
MNQGEKAFRSVNAGGKAGTWGGVLFSGLALAGLVAVAAAESPSGGGAPTTGPPPDGVNAAAAAGERGPAADPGCEDGTGGSPEAGAGRARMAEQAPDDPARLSPEEAADLDRRLAQAAASRQAPNSAAPTTIPVVVHVISHTDGSGDVDDATVDEQIAVMNKGFGGGYGGQDTGIRFELADVTRDADDTWFDRFAANERAIKDELHQGDAGTLNLYTVDLGNAILGQSTFPQEYGSDPKGDGVVVDHRTVPGGGRKGFDLGYTAVHEIGHWLGLYHTFQNGCEDPGDYVDDTPYEREQSSGCPKGRDTCRDREGTDPIHNFMNYSDDPCLNHFTKGQAERMSDAWTAFRT